MRKACIALLMILWGFCAALAVEKSPTIVYINGSKYYIHTVLPGETLYGIAKAYEVGERVILENNPTVKDGLRASESIKIPFVAQMTEPLSEKKLRKTFDTHTVSRGETLYAISRAFEIPVRTIIDDNPNIDPTRLRAGDKLLIRKREIGSENEAGSKAQWEEYRQSLNSVSESGTAYHIVRPGETLYSLARRFGIPEAELEKLNDGLKAADLKAGAMLKVPGGKGDAQLPAVEQQPADTVQSIAEQAPPTPEIPRIELRALRSSEPLNIALMLPIAVGNGNANSNFLEFYQGFLLGLDSVRTRHGYSVNLTLYNTGRDPEKIRTIVESPAFRDTHLVVGPVYEEGLQPVLRFAEENRIPVVSPLANITRVESDVLFQLAPAPTSKYEKAAGLISPDKHITLIYAGSTDKEFEQEMLSLLKDREYDKYTYKYVHPSALRNATESPSDLSPLLENGKDNLFIVMADNEVDVDRILAALASADTNITARGNSAPRFSVLGNTRWNRYNNLDRGMFFKDRVVFISTYHAKRDVQNILDFDAAYIRSFGSLPTLYSYRGYDAAAIFAPAMYNDIEYDMQGRRYTPLQTTYLFGQEPQGGNHTNRNWVRVNYNPDFTITVE